MPSDALQGVALVTGGGRGIGAAIARELTDAGMRVAVSGRTAAQVEAVSAPPRGHVRSEHARLSGAFLQGPPYVLGGVVDRPAAGSLSRYHRLAHERGGGDRIERPRGMIAGDGA